ncbi:MAG TPA: site-2 protease family protein [Gemmatimonadales bacterium]|nr:site-2 protease family protein [Gemmatimonadales bacterium]
MTALQQGDDTAYTLGRVTLNPIPHIDPWMSLLLPAVLFFLSHGQFTFGGAKPVPVNSRKFHNYRRGDIIVSAAGVTTNLFLSILFAGLFVLLGLVARTAPAAIGVVDTAQRMMVFGIYVNLLLCFFNLIPLPPLDGSHLLYHALPPRAGAWYRGLGRFGYLPLFAMMFLFQPVLAILLTPARAGLIFLLRLILPYRAGDGWNIFS